MQWEVAVTEYCTLVLEGHLKRSALPGTSGRSCVIVRLHDSLSVVHLLRQPLPPAATVDRSELGRCVPDIAPALARRLECYRDALGQVVQGADNVV